MIERVGLAGRAADLYRTYSLGMKQRLGIAASLLVEPTLLILDEPANGLDPAGIVEIRRLMRSLADDGITIIVSSHLLAEIEQVCDFFVMIQAGQLVFQGTPESLFADQRAELLARPEHNSDLETLAGAVRSAGRVARVEDGTVVVDAQATWAAELNRVAFTAGVTLAHLSERRRSLEEAFFKLTGSKGADALSSVDERRAS
ncbi:MAG TPA: ABC transporter ATP-binding protein [Acidimicrobiales bacterium]|nr:ABC transporter ATP-binding protein [Acidimicrobiales bacterium]